MPSSGQQVTTMKGIGCPVPFIAEESPLLGRGLLGVAGEAQAAAGSGVALHMVFPGYSDAAPWVFDTAALAESPDIFPC